MIFAEPYRGVLRNIANKELTYFVQTTSLITSTRPIANKELASCIQTFHLYQIHDQSSYSMEVASSNCLASSNNQRRLHLMGTHKNPSCMFWLVKPPFLNIKQDSTSSRTAVNTHLPLQAYTSRHQDTTPSALHKHLNIDHGSSDELRSSPAPRVQHAPQGPRFWRQR